MTNQIDGRARHSSTGVPLGNRPWQPRDVKKCYFCWIGCCECCSDGDGQQWWSCLVATDIWHQGLSLCTTRSIMTIHVSFGDSNHFSQFVLDSSLSIIVHTESSCVLFGQPCWKQQLCQVIWTRDCDPSCHIQKRTARRWLKRSSSFDCMCLTSIDRSTFIFCLLFRTLRTSIESTNTPRGQQSNASLSS